MILKRLDCNFKPDFLGGNTNTFPSSILYKFAQELYYTNQLRNDLSRYEIDHITVPFLRSIVESKIKQILGIDMFLDHKERHVGMSNIISILPQLKAIELHKAFDSDMLKLIVDWLSHFMHRGIRPPCFTLHAVFEYLRPMFEPGERVDGDRILFSIDISAFVKDLEVYHREVEEIIKSKYPGSFISWASKEVASFKPPRKEDAQ